MTKARGFTVERLTWRDIPVAEIVLPGGTVRLTLGLGSGLSRRPGDPPGRVWAIGDRGPNIKIEMAVERYGLDHLAPLAGVEGAKVMPRLDVGPNIVELQVTGGAVEMVRALPLHDPEGRPFNGLPTPGGDNAQMEPAFDLAGLPLGADVNGADTEGLAVMPDGRFMVCEEYAPSILQVDAEGVVRSRWVPEDAGPAFAGAAYAVEDVLPAIAARRRLNRGLESIAVSPDGRWLFTVFQSALNPGGARFARIWKVEAATGRVAAQYLYPFDPPGGFGRDRAAGRVRRRDLKVCDAAWAGPDRLLLLERITHTTKIYRVDLAGCETPPDHLDEKASPCLEQMDAAELAAAGVRPLAKHLVLSTDDAPEIGPDLEGMALLSDREMLLATDNDFGVEGAETHFYRVRFEAPLVA